MRAMTRLVSTSLLLLVCFAGCAGRQRPNAHCEWFEETASSLDLQNQTQQRHLSDDALVAEDLAIRYADSHSGPRSGHFEGITEYGRTRDQCMAVLFNTIAGNHRVTSEQVRESLVRRRTSLDLAVILSFAALYACVTTGLSRRLCRRFPLHEGWRAALLVTIVASAIVSFIGVLLGEQWSLAVEGIRVGNGHLSYRTFRVPWVQHRTELFVVGVFLFWLVAVLHYRVSIRDAGNPCPKASDPAVAFPPEKK